MPLVILPKQRDPRLVTVRRGGSLTDDDHRLLAVWAAACAEHVLRHVEQQRREETRPRDALGVSAAWVRGEASMREARQASFAANAAARELTGAARFAALSAGQAVAVAHVAAHDLGAAAYAIRAAAAADPEQDGEAAKGERDWQREQVPPNLLALVLEDQQNRNDLCWGVFAD
jgi:hypothetical protein